MVYRRNTDRNIKRQIPLAMKRNVSFPLILLPPIRRKQSENWIRSYTLDDRKLTITDSYTLEEAVAPNQVNFMTWGNVTFPSQGKIQIEVKGQKVELDYPTLFKAELETIQLDDPRLSNVWGKEIYRITLKQTKRKKLEIISLLFNKLNRIQQAE